MTQVTKTKTSISLAAITGILLLSAVLAVPNLSAFADHEGNGKGHGKKNHQKTREGDDKNENDNNQCDSGKYNKHCGGDDNGDKERCENGASGKYNKHCDENDDHEKTSGKGIDQGKGGDEGNSGIQGQDNHSAKSNGKGHSSGKED